MFPESSSPFLVHFRLIRFSASHGCSLEYSTKSSSPLSATSSRGGQKSERFILIYFVMVLFVLSCILCCVAAILALRVLLFNGILLDGIILSLNCYYVSHSCTNSLSLSLPLSLSPSFSLSLYLFLCPSLSISLYLYIYISIYLSISGLRQRLLPSRVRRLSCTCNVSYCPVIEHRMNCRYPQDPDGCGRGDKPLLSVSATGILLLFRCHTLGCLVYILSMMVLT
jgi:hypothetical protein